MTQRLILFGAFDRHNFGDLLFPHIVGKLMPGRTVEYAGLADRDLRPFGGHLVKSISSINGNENDALIHCGGELLTCTAYQAAVMLQTPEAAEQAIMQYDADAEAAARWAADVLHVRRAIPYVAGSWPGRLAFNAVGAVGWPRLDTGAREEVIASLRQASWVSVRDEVTQGHLREVGVDASLCPDPAVMVRECFGDVIAQHRQQGEVAQMCRSLPQGFVACQFSADFADDETLDQLASSLERVCAETGHGIVLFRAGAAPWHDQLEPYARLAQRLPGRTVRTFESLHLWDICALIAASRGFCGSSLHGSIVALGYALPAVSLTMPGDAGRLGKVLAYRETWEPDARLRCVAADELESGFGNALRQTRAQLEQTAANLASRYAESQRKWMALLGR